MEKINELCPECKNEMYVYTTKDGKSEMVFEIKKPLFCCKKCNKKFEECDLCGGTGYYPIHPNGIFESDFSNCEMCKGTGFIEIK